MNDLDKLRTEHEAHRGRAEKPNPTRYGEALNRYLGTVGYRPDAPGRPAPVPTRKGLVLVGADESPTSHTAVDHAAIEAELHGWDLRILHVQRAGPHRQTARAAGAVLLERLTDRVHTCAPAVAVTSRLLIGPATPSMLAEARKADLVVVGRHHGVAAAVLGLSVGDAVATDHHGVVLVVRIPGWPPAPEFGPRPVVVGVDSDDNPAVGFAHDEARVRGCDLVLLHAARTPRLPVVNTVGGVRVRRRFVAEAPAAALIEASRHASALVVGRHGPRGGPSGSLGSVTRSVLGHTHCPVFLVG